MARFRWARILFFIFLLVLQEAFELQNVEPQLIKVWGPGLNPMIVMPARYFFVEYFDSNNLRINLSNVESPNVLIEGNSESNKSCRLSYRILDRQDASFIIRYKIYEICENLKISITYKNQHVAESPYLYKYIVYPDDCNCPLSDIRSFFDLWQCGPVSKSIQDQIELFGGINWNKLRKKVIKHFNKPHSVSICHYIIKKNQINRKCYGKYVGFSMFVDAVLLSLARKVQLPDLEFFANLGDWPLATHNLPEKYPILSWCGSADSYDIIMPTYDITESSLENMGRVTLDMLSVQGNTEVVWESRIPKLFWRGRDSNKRRLDLVKMAQDNPELFNVSLTNFFFYRDEEHIYGPKSEHVSFFKFFEYKYQLAVDGTVAPYRMPYLLAGGSLVFKPESKYFEYFYKDLEPYVHYVPVESDLSDLIDKLKWAQENDNEAKKIAQNGQRFANTHLLPKNIFCYHLQLLHEFFKNLKSPVEVLDGMEQVDQKNLINCDCSKNVRDEL